MDFNLDKSLSVLERTPRVLRTFLAGLSSEWTLANEGAETWSPFDIVGHLADAEEANWIVRARLILAQGSNRRFEPFDRTRHLSLKFTQTLEQRLDRFETLRKANLAELESLRLTPDQLDLKGEHPEFGPVTLGQLLSTWVVHDLGHLAQIARVMAGQYREAVGPWEAYLPVLQRRP